MANEEAQVTVEVVEQTTQELAPAEKTPSLTREFFLKPPDWRYQEAMIYLHKEKAGKVSTAPSDPFVQLSIRTMRALQNPETRDYLNILSPDLVSVFELGTVAKTSSISAEIETNLICGIKSTDVKSLDISIPPVVYDLYAKVFFDLTGITAVHSWMNDFLFDPVRYSDNPTLLRSRLLAYYGGRKHGLMANTYGGPSEATMAIMKQITASERQKKIFDYVTRKLSISTENYIEIMEAAVKSMTERDFQEHMKDRDEAGSSSLEELAQHLEQGIRAFSQQEIEQTNENGLDFVNQYTAAILRKDDTNGK